MSEAAAPGFSLKDTIVILPVMGTGLAMCWEVGSFLPIGGAAFSYFSITEHLAFAVPALPFAILFSLSIICGAAFTERFVALELRIRGLGRTLFILLSVLALLSLYWLIVYGRSAFYLTLALTSVFLLATQLVAEPKLRLGLTAGGIVISMLLLALAAGVDFMRYRLSREAPATIDTAAGSVSGVVVRAGERGVMMYDRAGLKFTFVRWDAVKGIDWQRAPLLRAIAPKAP